MAEGQASGFHRYGYDRQTLMVEVVRADNLAQGERRLEKVQGITKEMTVVITIQHS